MAFVGNCCWCLFTMCSSLTWHVAVFFFTSVIRPFFSDLSTGRPSLFDSGPDGQLKKTNRYRLSLTCNGLDLRAFPFDTGERADFNGPCRHDIALIVMSAGSPDGKVQR